MKGRSIASLGSMPARCRLHHHCNRHFGALFPWATPHFTLDSTFAAWPEQGIRCDTIAPSSIFRIINHLTTGELVGSASVEAS